MSKDANTELINRFYTAFQKRDADAMNACYAPGIRFSDPVFGALEDDRAWAMWKMLAGRSAGLELTYQVGAVDDSTGNATWQDEVRLLPDRPQGRQPHQLQVLVRERPDRSPGGHLRSLALGLDGTGAEGPIPRLAAPVQGAILKQAAGGLEAFIKSL